MYVHVKRVDDSDYNGRHFYEQILIRRKLSQKTIIGNPQQHRRLVINNHSHGEASVSKTVEKWSGVHPDHFQQPSVVYMTCCLASVPAANWVRPGTCIPASRPVLYLAISPSSISRSFLRDRTPFQICVIPKEDSYIAVPGNPGPLQSLFGVPYRPLSYCNFRRQYDGNRPGFTKRRL